MKINNICCIGAGYVGGPTMAVFAHKCPDIKITVVDSNKEKIKLWNSKNLENLPVYEPGLAEIIEKTRNKNLFFSTEIDKAIDESEMIFMSVNTPTKTEGEGKGMAADLTFIENCARNIGLVSKSDKIIVEKSTLPVRTAEKIKEVLDTNNNLDVNFEILSNPEFLAEGTAISDLLNPDRVLIGGRNSKNGKKAVELLVEIYQRWIPKNKIVTTNIWSSELSKLVSNAFLAQRISSINSISALCEKTEANVDEVAQAVGMDSRIGSSFLKSSIGFGGSCFQKDILNLVYIAGHYGLDEVADYWESVIKINNYQTNRLGKKIIEILKSEAQEKQVTILGWAFKKDTNDSRESASIYLSKQLLEKGINVKVYDPMVSKSRIIEDLKFLLKNKRLKNVEIDNFLSQLIICNDVYDATFNSSLIAISTEWDEFKILDWNKIYNEMKKPAWILDGRNLLEKDKLNKIGFKTFFIGQV